MQLFFLFLLVLANKTMSPFSSILIFPNMEISYIPYSMQETLIPQTLYINSRQGMQIVFLRSNMDARIRHRVMLFLLCAFFVSETSIAEKLSSEAILQTRKLDYKEKQALFSFPIVTTQRQTIPGSIPIINPTPGTTPIVNPITIPPPPATTIPPPPATTIPPPPATTIPPPPATTIPSGGVWCTANPTASPTALQVALDYACGYGGTDCTAILPNGPCYDPDTVRDHASYAFNDYYQKNPTPTSCVFGGAAQLTYNDPSYGSCRYASPTSTTTPNPPAIPLRPPSTTTPINPYTPGGNPYGSEPTGFDYGNEPPSNTGTANVISTNLLLFSMSCLVLSVVLANHF